MNGHATGYNDGCQYVHVNWNDCIWELLDSDIFLRNVNHTGSHAGMSNSVYMHTITGAGTTGGDVTHTHTTGNHTLTTNEIPPHSHQISSQSGPNGSNNSRDHFYPTGIAWNADNAKYTWTDGGGGQAHNHGDTGSASSLPPYITVYMYKRIA